MSGEQMEATAARVAVALSVPALSVAAHGHAGGPPPGIGAILLSAGVGLIAALVALPTSDGRHRRFVRVGAARVAFVLAGSQISTHLLLAMTAANGHLAVGADTRMVAAHAVATVLTAMLIPVAAGLAAVASSTIRALRYPAVRLRHRAVRAVPAAYQIALTPTVCGGGRGLRGPPAFR